MSESLAGTRYGLRTISSRGVMLRVYQLRHRRARSGKAFIVPSGMPGDGPSAAGAVYLAVRAIVRTTGGLRTRAISHARQPTTMTALRTSVGVCRKNWVSEPP